MSINIGITSYMYKYKNTVYRDMSLVAYKRCWVGAEAVVCFLMLSPSLQGSCLAWGRLEFTLILPLRVDTAACWYRCEISSY
jgi:hypothetical protein